MNQSTEVSQLPQSTTTASSGTKGTVLLQTASAIARNEDGTKSTRVKILFDNGSQRSYVTDNLKSKLGLKSTKKEMLHLNTFGEKTFRKQKCDVLTLFLEDANEETSRVCVLSFPTICSPLPSRVDANNYPHLHGLKLADYSDSEDSIDVLIGSDYYWDFVTSETIRGDFGPTAVRSKLGWLLSGPTNHSQNETNVVSNLVISGEPHFSNGAKESDEMADMLKRFCDVQHLGIVDTDCESELIKRKGEIKFNGSNYEVGLPWKGDCLPQSNNYGMCVTRVRSLHSKLRSDTNLQKEYDNIIQEQKKNGIVEIVPQTEHQTLEEGKLSTRRIHYSPHHAVVFRDRETTKVRIVYDGSAKNCKDERSLNDCLEVGENYIPHIFEMLTRFLWNFVALTAHIEKAFLMVGIKSEDRDMLHFLWFKDPLAEKPEINEYRFNRLVFGLRPSPSILGETIAHHLNLYRQSEPEMYELLRRTLYVDDLLIGEENDENGFLVYQKSKKIMASGGFNLRKWNSNSQTLLKSIETCESSQNQRGSVDHVTRWDFSLRALWK